MNSILIGLVVFGVILGLIIPIIAVVKCATSNLSKRSKTLWIVCMVLALPLTGYLYLTLHAKTRLRRIFSALIFVLAAYGTYLHYQTILSVINDYSSNDKHDIAAMPQQPPMGQSLIEEAKVLAHDAAIKKIEATVESLKVRADKNPDVIKDITDDLELYEEELKASSPLDGSDQGKTATALCELAFEIANGDVSPEQQERWNTAFANRNAAPAPSAETPAPALEPPAAPVIPTPPPSQP